MSNLAVIENIAVTPAIGKITATANWGENVLNNFYNRGLIIFWIFIAASFIVMLIWGGAEYITSAGDKEGSDRARKKITNALIGIIIAFSLYAILDIIEQVFGFSIKKIPIPIIR